MRRRTFFGLTLVLAILAGLHGSAKPTLPAGFLSTTDWLGEGKFFGGFSSIAVTDTGAGFVAVSDHGAWVRGQMQRDAAGMLTGVSAGKVTALQGTNGKVLHRGQTDSEGLALTQDGGFYVSFEGPALVRFYPVAGRAAIDLPYPPAFARMRDNAALEALCIGADGSLYTLPEDSGSHTRPFPVFRFADGAWTDFATIPRSDEFRAVDCALGPDGRFYLLSRAFYGLGGFASRLERFTLSDTGLSDRVQIFQTDNGTFDDLEGLSVWRDAQGLLRATMVSDNNFSFFFQTQIVEFRLPS